MDSSLLDTRVTFEEKVKVPNGGGGHSIQWQEMLGIGLGKRWAAVWAMKPGASDEETTTSRVSNAPDYRLIVQRDRGTVTVKSEWRVKIDETYFAIKSVTRPDRVTGKITMIIQEGQAT